ncbi:MAG: Fe-S protein assembly co-chaperone HscB [Betaproteobacteria bacterium]|nr:Fe-S protein assembly co-chaperone HscB [Betaproteobacteria bacterium]
MKNHFELFGITPAYALDLAHLYSAYRNIQSKIHPDRYANAGDAERRASMQMTTQVNEAYRALKSPVQRAKYLLALNGVDVGFETNTAMPRDFLVEQMELREKLEEAKNSADLDFISRDLAVARREIENQIQEEIDCRHDFAAARDLVRKLMFLERFGEDIDAAHERVEMQAPES